MPNLILKHPYHPKGVQIEFCDVRTRFTIARIGRQWGKSYIAMHRLFTRAIHGPQDGVYWWVEPTISQSKVHMLRALRYYASWRKDNQLTDRTITLHNNAVIYFKGAENREALEGDTLAGCVLDEAAKLDSEVWTGTVRPMLAVKQGWADIIGKPRGNNWFKQLWTRAQNDKDWSTFHYASHTSPFFSMEEYEAARLDTPSQIFSQEYDAEFIDSAGTVFRNVEASIRSKLEPPVSTSRYFAGIDLARAVDFTVILIMDHQKRVVDIDRFNNIPWSEQKRRIIAKVAEYNATVLIDSTGIGDPVFDDLAMTGMKISGLKFTNASKRTIIEDLIVTLENGDLDLIDDPVLIDELNNFEVEVGHTGFVRYAAGSGHDDTVIALALANYISVKIVSNMFESAAERHTTGLPTW